MSLCINKLKNNENRMLRFGKIMLRFGKTKFRMLMLIIQLSKSYMKRRIFD